MGMHIHIHILHTNIHTYTCIFYMYGGPVIAWIFKYDSNPEQLNKGPVPSRSVDDRPRFEQLSRDDPKNSD